MKIYWLFKIRKKKVIDELEESKLWWSECRLNFYNVLIRNVESFTSYQEVEDKIEQIDNFLSVWWGSIHTAQNEIYKSFLMKFFLN